MKSLLEYCESLPELKIESGVVVLREGEQSDQLFVLLEGAMEVYRGDDTIAMVADSGAVFGEMSVLLDMAHTANVRAARPSSLCVVNEARAFLSENPAFVLPIARMLASRLRNSTTYLVDMKRQFRDHSDHFAMVDQVLESMAHDQDQDFTPDEQLPADP